MRPLNVGFNKQDLNRKQYCILCHWTQEIYLLNVNENFECFKIGSQILNRLINLNKDF